MHRRIRNRLSLDERMEVIRTFKHFPSYKHIAERFNCSARQIRSIVSSEEAVIKEFNNPAPANAIEEARRARRAHKIEFFDKVILEYVERTAYHNVPITEELVRQRAYDLNDILNIENFGLSYVWMDKFKLKNKLPDFELATLRKILDIKEPKANAFEYGDIIPYVQRQNEKRQQQKLQEQLQQQQQHQKQQRPELEQQISSKKLPEVQASLQPSTINVLLDEDDVDGDEFMTIDKQGDQEEPNSEAEFVKIEETNATESTPALALPDITDYQEALQVLKLLQTFSMQQADYRAIGLIVQLERVYKNPLNRSDTKTS